MIIRSGVTALMAIAALAALTAPAPAEEAPGTLLRVDAGRDGTLSAADDAGRATWTSGRGAIMLPNLDDDTSRCPATGSSGARLTDAALAACHDAADAVVNGAADLADLAPMRLLPVPGTTDSARATLTPDPRSRDKVRVFIERDGRYVALGADGAVRPGELRDGAKFAVEARDIVRDPAVWAGFSDLTLTVTDQGKISTDRVRLKVAPVLFQHDLLPLRRAVVADPAQPASLEGGEAPGEPSPGAAEYRRDLRRGLDAEGLNRPFVESPAGGDQWMGDMFKAGYASMPGPGGREHRITVNLRSPAIMPDSTDRDRPLRDASRPVFTMMRGKDVAGIQEFDATRIDRPDDNLYYGSASSSGNFGTIPPHGKYPTGRIVYGGSGKFSPDSDFTRMLAAQGRQDPIAVDTSWLGVGHLDEFLHFVPAKNGRGWAAVVADPRMGMDLLEKLAAGGGGGQRLVEGVDPQKTDDPNITVAEALRKPELQEGVRLASQGIDGALRRLREQAGITEQDIIRIPALFKKLDIPADYPRENLVATYLPNAANGISTGTGGYLAPAQHSPRTGGKDLFELTTERALAQAGVRVRWIEDWEYSHNVGTVGGDIHCVTNVQRDLSGTAPWWKPA
ncbi:protein-arginine deiminase family protein [Actinomadura vinacea]